MCLGIGGGGGGGQDMWYTVHAMLLVNSTCSDTLTCVQTGHKLCVLSGHEGPVTCVLPLRDDSSAECSSIMTASTDMTIRVSCVCLSVSVCVSVCVWMWMLMWICCV